MVFALGALVFLPAVLTPFFLDDYLHASMVDGTFPVARSPFDLYDFVDDGDRAALLSRGLLPWWTHPGLAIRFFRPLSSALLYVDHRVFGRAALPMHLHSLAWWALAVLAARALFRSALGEAATRRVLVLATAIFALAPCHALPIAWLANREALVSLAFGALALAAYARFREAPSSRDAALAAALFMLALLGGGEYALTFGGYVVAIEVVRRKDPLARRALGLATFAAPAALYLAVRGALHYGTNGSGFYSDPLRDPVTFLAKAPWRAVALASDAWLSFDAGTVLATWQRAVVAVGVALAALALRGPVRRALASLPPRARASATWLTLGSLLSLAPVLAVVPSPRLVGVSMLGVSVVVALVLDRAWFSGERDARRGFAELVAIGLGFAHLVHGPVSALASARQLRHDAASFDARATTLAARLGDVPGARVAVVRGLAGTFFMPFALDDHGAQPARWCVLAHAGHVLARRTGERSLELVAAEGHGLFPATEAELFRSEGAPLRVGDVVRVPGLRATVLETSADGPRRVAFAFDDDLGSLVWTTDDQDTWHEITLPDVGFGAPFDP